MTEEDKIQQKIRDLKKKIKKTYIYKSLFDGRLKGGRSFKTVALGVAMATVPTVAGAVPNSNTRPDDKPKDKTEQVDNSNKNFSNSSSYIAPCSKDINANLDLGNGATLLNELPTKGVATYNIQGVTFTDEDFAGAPKVSIIDNLIEKCRVSKKNYGQHSCVAAIKRELIPLIPRSDITLKGRTIIDKAVKGCQVDTAFLDGEVIGWVSFICKGQEETFENIDGYFSCQYPEDVKKIKNYGHMGFRYIDPVTHKQYEYRGCMEKGGKKIVKMSGRSTNKYDNNKRKVITRIEYLQYALNKKLENGEKLYFIKNEGSNIIDIYTPETLPEKIKSQIATVTPQEVQMAMKVGKNVMFAEQDKDSPDTLNVTSIESMKKIEEDIRRQNPNAQLLAKLAKSHKITHGKGRSSDGSDENGDSGENNSDGTAVTVAATSRVGSPSQHLIRDYGRS